MKVRKLTKAHSYFYTTTNGRKLLEDKYCDAYMAMVIVARTKSLMGTITAEMTLMRQNFWSLGSSFSLNRVIELWAGGDL